MADLSALRAEIERRSQAAFTAGLDTMRDLLVDAAPEDTGELKGSVVVTEAGGFPAFSGRVEFTAPQGRWTNDGSAPHTIEGNPLLAFEVGGRTVIVHSVQHPGTKATHWFDNAATAPAWAESLTSGFAAA